MQRCVENFWGVRVALRVASLRKVCELCVKIVEIVVENVHKCSGKVKRS